MGDIGLEELVEPEQPIEEVERLIGSTGQTSRRDFLKWLGATTALSILPNYSEAKKPKHPHRDYASIPVPKLGYSPIVKEPSLRGVDLVDLDSYRVIPFGGKNIIEGTIGRIERAIRWENIADVVADRFGGKYATQLKYYLLGMMVIESLGDPTKPNSLGDGGVGLIHMQPKRASEYGLKLITDSKKLRDFYQGRKIERAIDAMNGDLKDLIRYDERFHPIKNIDAAARMLCDDFEKTHTWTGEHIRYNALERYAGREEYDERVEIYARLMQDERFMAAIKRAFNNRNKELIVRGNPLTFDRYLSFFHQLNRNYGLDRYRQLRRLPVCQPA